MHFSGFLPHCVHLGLKKKLVLPKISNFEYNFQSTPRNWYKLHHFDAILSSCFYPENRWKAYTLYLLH
jgi:hypothetical protein